MTARRIFLGAVIFAASCQVPADLASQTVSSAASDGASDRVADALVEADVAFANRETERLRQAIWTLDALGAQPRDEAGSMLLREWKASLPPGDIPTRGRTLGPAFLSGEVAPNATIDFEQTFLAGQRAEIAARTHGGTPIGLTVIDGRAKTLCASSGNRIRCRWTPPYTQRHLIRIDNPRSATVKYFISFI
ncbi:hypothetical protein [Qipengyuania sp. MTN3-11]|uniref:hypothetical protein n=1 Tax=Qipengyuania sp. MTN3-11 TaxID=3056557 RepID=UPI0036F1E01E